MQITSTPSVQMNTEDRHIGNSWQFFKESALTVGLAIILGGVLSIVFVPGVKEAVWPAINALLNVF